MINKKNKMIIIGIVIVIIIAIAGYFLYNYVNEQSKSSQINDYKKGFYEGILCDYSCPLTMQNVTVKNKTEERMLPTLDCIKNCALPFKQKYANFKVSSAELNESDSLLKDIDSVKSDCIKKSTNMTSLSLNNPVYFNCSKEELAQLRDKYGYLK